MIRDGRRLSISKLLAALIAMGLLAGPALGQPPQQAQTGAASPSLEPEQTLDREVRVDSCDHLVPLFLSALDDAKDKVRGFEA